MDDSLFKYCVVHFSRRRMTSFHAFIGPLHRTFIQQNVTLKQRAFSRAFMGVRKEEGGEG